MNVRIYSVIFYCSNNITSVYRITDFKICASLNMTMDYIISYTSYNNFYNNIWPCIARTGVSSMIPLNYRSTNRSIYCASSRGKKVQACMNIARTSIACLFTSNSCKPIRPKSTLPSDIALVKR